MSRSTSATLAPVTSSDLTQLRFSSYRLVGDSLSEQHHEIVRNFLVSHGGPYQLRFTGSRPRIDEVFLDPNHELTQHYLRAAGVTAERLKNPITTFFLERHLLSMAEYDQVNSHVERYVPLSEDDGPHQSVSESLWDARYREQLERPVTFTVEEGIGENAKVAVQEEPTILVLNTGPHWIASEIGTHSVPDADVLKSYNNMVSWSRLERFVVHLLTADYSLPADRQSAVQSYCKRAASGSQGILSSNITRA